MGNPIENLGDYNRARIDLQAKNGDLDALYKDVGDTAVAKAAPGLILLGATVGIGLWNMGKKGIRFIKERKNKIKNEPALKKRFKEEVMIESSETNVNDHVS